MGESQWQQFHGQALAWQDGLLWLLDQRLLPGEQHYLSFATVDEVATAIQTMVVRGAPAIGIAAAYGVVLAGRASYQQAEDHWQQSIEPLLTRLVQARPTAVNLQWAVNRMRAVIGQLPARENPELPLLYEAKAIHEEDLAANRHMGALGYDYIRSHSLSQNGAPFKLMTHCNAGALATGGYGTALGVVRAVFAGGDLAHVYANETRPWLQGARLTAWELDQENIPVSLNADVAAAYLLGTEKIDWIIVGADRVAANGDVINKIGTYGLAILARYHGAGFMVVAPSSTVDMDTAKGADVVIEEREGSELLEIGGQLVGAEVAVRNPVFDVTPASLVDVLVTEKGVVEKPSKTKMAQLFSG